MAKTDDTEWETVGIIRNPGNLKEYDKASDVPLEKIAAIVKAIEEDGDMVVGDLCFKSQEEACKFGQLVVDWLNNKNEKGTMH